MQTQTSNLRSSLSPLDSALTSKRASKSFTSNTYEKHTQGEGGPSSVRTRITNHQFTQRPAARAEGSQFTKSPAALNCHLRTGPGVLSLIHLLCLSRLVSTTIPP